MNKTKILKKNYEFKKVLSKGKYYSGQTIEAFIMPNRRNINYLGIAISRKSGHAILRNKAKRLIKENYRLSENNIDVGYSIIFLWKKNNDLKNANFYQIKEDIYTIFKSSNIIGKS